MNQASIFTIEKKGDNYKNITEFPKDLYVDTSGWLLAYGSSNSYYPQQAKEFLADCVESGTTLYHSGLVITEARHVNKTAHIRKLADDFNIRIPHYDNGTVNHKKLTKMLQGRSPHLYQEIYESNEKLLKNIRNNSIFLEYEVDEDAVNEMTKIVESSGNILGEQDAWHVYIARLYGINSFFTSDADFISLDNDNIFVPPHERYVKEAIGRNNVLLPFDDTQY